MYHTQVRDPLEELERMARNAATATEDDPSDEEIERWMTLFKYDDYQARMLIQNQRRDIARERISDEHWALRREDCEAAGHSRESYEHSLGLNDLLSSQSSVVYDADGVRWTVVKLGGLIESAEKVKEIAGLENTPDVTTGTGEFGIADFCWIDGESAGKVRSWLALQQVIKKPKGSGK